MPILGSYARVRTHAHGSVWERLSALPGVTCFELGERERIGVLIEVESLANARHLVEECIPRIDGLLGLFPVTIDYQDELAGEVVRAQDGEVRDA